MDTNEWNKILKMLADNNVASVNFDSAGNIIGLLFNGAVVPMAVPAQDVNPEPTRESDIDLALHPPEDVRHPVDDGKE